MIAYDYWFKGNISRRWNDGRFM